MRTQLLPHNRTAYQKVMKAFETSWRTCVVHPTGTGKSYLIAAVSENFKKVLILGPNIFVLDQVQSVLSWRKTGTDYMTYPLLMRKDESPTGYDLICLDEFHRAGAPEWGDAVERLLEANPEAKVFGTTATPIRFLDDNRNMADELFQENIASYMTLKEAIDRNILVTPRFVTGLFDFEKVACDAEERIRNSRRINDDEKRGRLTKISNLKLDWERSSGMPTIIRKHIDKSANRVIVFCGNVDKLHDMEQTVRIWFQKAGIKVSSVFMMHTYMSDNEIKKAMNEFSNDSHDGVKLMLSVNMLNEGVHIPRVNAVILLRTTSSKIIYLQQIGRCLTADKTDKPIILDMVDNITTTNIVHHIKEGFDWYEHQSIHDDEERGNREKEQCSFDVYDYTLGIRDALEKLVPVEWTSRTFDDRLAQVVAFCKRNNRVPGKRDDVEEKRNWYVLRDTYSERQEIKDLVKKYHNEKNREQRIEWLQQYVKNNGRLPSGGKNATESELAEYRIYAALRDERPCDKRVLELIERYSIRQTDERLLQAYLDFVKNHDRLPEHVHRKTPKDEFNLADCVARRLKNHPEVMALWQKYKKTQRTYLSVEERMGSLEAFIDRENRLPCKKEEAAYANLKELKRINSRKVVTGFDELLTKYSRCKDDNTVAREAQQVIDFLANNHRLPRYDADDAERKINLLMTSLLKSYSNHQKVDELKKIKAVYAKKKCNNEEIKNKILTFVSEHNRLPLATRPGEASLRRSWNSRKNLLCANDPEMQAIRDMYTRRQQPYNEMYDKVRDFCQRERRLPRKADGDVYRCWDRLRSTYIHKSEVANIAVKYGYKPGKPLLDIDAILCDVEMFAIEHGRLPSTSASDRQEYKLARRWHRFKRRYSDNPKVAILKERYPIQNRK